MGFAINYDDFDPDEVGGKDQVLAGDYHMLVVNVNEDGDKGDMEVDLQVLRGTTPGQECKEYRLKLKKDYGKWPQRKLAAFAKAARLRTADQLKSGKASGKDDVVEWTQAINRSICMRLETSDDGKWTNLAWDSIWSPDDKRANHIPLNENALKRDGIKLPANRPIDGVLATRAANGQQRQSAASQQKAAKAAETSANDLLDGVI
jgi:hypothetical protein